MAREGAKHLENWQHRAASPDLAQEKSALSGSAISATNEGCSHWR